MNVSLFLIGLSPAKAITVIPTIVEEHKILIGTN